MRQCIFVFGMHRSGTSAMMGLLNTLDVDVGPNDMPPNTYNEKGYYENMDTCRLNDDILDSLHSSWDDPSLLSDVWWKQSHSMSQFSESIINIIKDNYKNSDLFGIKDPRISRLFPLWHEALDELGIQSRAIICFRNPLEVAQSLKKRDGFSINKSLMLWLTYMFEAEFFTKKVKRTFVSFDDLLGETPKVLKRISDILSIDLHDKLQDQDSKLRLSSFLSKGLRHHNINGAKLNSDVWDHIVKAYDLLSRFDGEISEETITEFDGLRRTYQVLNGVFYNIDVKNKVFYHGKLLQEKIKLESVVNSKEDQISELNSIINEKDNQITNIMRSLKESEVRIGDLEEALREKEVALIHIYNSHGWKFLLRYYKMRDYLLPSNSKRRNFAKKIFSTLINSIDLQVKLNEKDEKKTLDQSNEHLQSNIFKKIDSNNYLLNEDDCWTKGKEKDAILVIDRSLPEYDKDSGSLRMFFLLNILSESSYRVTFLPDDLRYTEPYANDLHKMGIEVLHGNIVIEEYFKNNGCIFTHVIISRPECFFKYITFVKAYSLDSNIIYDTVDLHWIRFERAASLNGNQGLLGQAGTYKKMELFNASCSDITLTVTQEEKEVLLRELPNLRIEVVPNIHEIHQSGKSFNNRKDLMFIGGFEHQPNVDAVKYFCAQILPSIEEKLNGIRFYVVGSKPPEEILKLNSENIIVTGYVKDVSPYFENCRVFVSPLRYGAGMKGKIGHSMAYGLPLVTTFIGAEGIGLINGKNALIADEPDNFAHAVVNLYNDENLWRKLSTNSRDHIASNYSKKIISKKVVNMLFNAGKADA